MLTQPCGSVPCGGARHRASGYVRHRPRFRRAPDTVPVLLYLPVLLYVLYPVAGDAGLV